LGRSREELNHFCASCRLTRIIPDLTVNGHKIAWAKFEAAKRRLCYSLLGLGLPVKSRAEDPETGVCYEFLADLPDRPILTGHEFGVITINVAEGDDAERERRRLQLHEPYRTILGHFRHEIGHYYCDRFFLDEASIVAFRKAFGDETQDYAESLKRYYENGPQGDGRKVSSRVTQRPTLGKIGRKPGHTTSIWPTHLRRRRRSVYPFGQRPKRALAPNYRSRVNLLRSQDRKLVLRHIHAQ
jgi:hypothetical protein